MNRPFWKEKTLEQMSPQEWESLCDGCGRCCLVKLEEEETERVYYTDVACRLFDTESCRCRNYPQRTREVPECVQLTPQMVYTVGWLPPTCAYRLVAEGKDLYDWHPLKSGTPESVVSAGVSVKGRMGGTEGQVPQAIIEQRIVDWPLRVPRRGGRRGPKSGSPPASRKE